MKVIKSVRAIWIFFFVLTLGCSTVPLTGRKQFTAIPTSEINALSFQSYQEVISSSTLSTNREYVDRVRRVGQKLSASVMNYMRQNKMADKAKAYRWEYNVIAENTVNAWAMPGGKVAFYEGIMPICQNDEGVAVVMSHEIAHAIASHGNERMSQGLAAEMGGIGLAIAMQNQPAETQSLAMAAFGAGATIGVILPFSRKHESEADELGLYFMAMAGYDVYEAPKFWQRMKAATSGEGRPPEFLSTHPDPDKRIQKLQQAIPKALKYKDKY